ncbi:MAG: OB-fold domain-containing protein [Methanobacteriota archaeon]
MSAAAIRAHGVALPRFAIGRAAFEGAAAPMPRGIDEKRVPGFDEDASTLALEAARRCLSAAGRASAPADVVVGTSDPAVATWMVAGALGGPAQVRLVASGSHAGLEALAAAADAAREGREALAVATDAPVAAAGTGLEAGLGAAAVAFLVAPGDGLRIDDLERVTLEGPGGRRLGANRFLVVSPGDDPAPSAAYEAARRLAARVPDGPTHRAPQEEAGVASAVARALASSRAAPGVQAVTGETGAASAPLALAALLSSIRASETVLSVAACGPSAIAIRATATGPVAGPDVHAMLKRGGHAISRERHDLLRRYGEHYAPRTRVSQGAYVSASQYERTLPQRLRMVGARCEGCRRLFFPRRESCPECGGRRFKEAPLSGRGTIYAVTEIGRGAAPSEFAEQQQAQGEYPVAVVELAEGPRVAAQIADATAAEVPIGTPVRAIVRRLYEQEGAVRYGFKFVPDAGI